MTFSVVEQFAQVVSAAGVSANAHLCEGDSTAAVIWDDSTQITVRLSLRDDEVWILAGSGILVRSITDSEGEFDRVLILDAIRQILRGEAIEYFGVTPCLEEADTFATGFEIRRVGAAAGLDASSAAFRARLAGPLAQAALDT